MKKSQKFFMNRAFEIATKIDPHKTAPNPRVGCLIVKNGKIISEGVHEKFGSAHAEINACRNISSLSNCEVYITLEPCNIFSGKKTPSCTHLLIQKNPKKIYIGSIDPIFHGKNIEFIKNKGIDIQILDFEKQNKYLNPFFPRKNRPYVGLKIAQTLDAKIDLSDISFPEGKPYITNDVSRKKVHQLRKKYSGILTTTETVLKDDPLFSIREDLGEVKSFSNPDIFILGDRRLGKKIYSSKRIFSIPNRKVIQIKRAPLKKSLEKIWSIYKIDSLLVEGGSWLMNEFLKNGIVDEIEIFIAPKISGKGKHGFGIEKFLGNFELKENKNLAGDLYLRFVRNREDEER